MLYVGNGEAHSQETHRKVKRNTMKVQLKQGVSQSDIPRISGIHKSLIFALASGKKVVELEVLPKGLDKFVEPVPSKEKKQKGVK